MVGIVIVSHSEALAGGVVALAREMGGEQLAIEPAGGIEDPDSTEPVLGTDAERVRAAIEQVMSDDGVLVLMDLGSALMSAEFAVELLADAPGRVLLSEAPLVEGAVAAAVAAAGGAALDDVAAEARGALAMKAAQLGVQAPADEGARHAGSAGGADTADSVERAEPAAPTARAELAVRNRIGLHARPAARFVATVRRFEADVRVAGSGGGEPVRAGSLTDLVALGARFGDTLTVTASGPQAADAVAALERLAAEGFGDGAVDGEPEARAATPPRPGAGEPTAASQPAAGLEPDAAPPAGGDVLAGVPVSAGVAIGPARRLGAVRLAAPPEHPASDSAAGPAADPAAQRARLQRALAAARAAIEHDRDGVAARAGRAEAEIFDAHLALLDDDALLEPADAAIGAGAGAERAWYDAVQAVAARYRSLPQPLLAERATDVIDVGRRVQGALAGGSAGPGEPGDGATGATGATAIIIADELTPAQAAALDPGRVLGIATARGSATAHAAILARALGLPAVVGLGAAVLAVPDDTPLLLDGEQGTLQVDPPPAQRDAARERRRRLAHRRAAAREHAGEAAVTRDGHVVEVFANLGAAGEAADAVALGAEGVGLLRTEFLFLGRDALPDEQEQAETLRQIAVALQGRPLIVRTLDAGADKPLPALPMPPEENPFLGVRGIRLALARPDVLATQLRAILRVAAGGHPVKAMLPMVATLSEVRATRQLLDEARAQTGIDVPLELGIMVEVPAAALTAARLAPHVDFFSLGTNDLTQYTMAAERGDARLAALLAGPQPGVLALVAATVAGARDAGRWVGVCGELAGDPAAAVLLAGLGVTELSMAAGLIAEVKAALREVTLAQARAAAQAALAVEDAGAARALALDLL